MFFNVLGTWIRGLLSVGLLVAVVVFVKQWMDELPREERIGSTASGEVVTRPLPSLTDRIRAWRPGADAATALLVAAALTLFLISFG